MKNIILLLLFCIGLQSIAQTQEYTFDKKWSYKKKDDSNGLILLINSNNNQYLGLSFTDSINKPNIIDLIDEHIYFESFSGTKKYLSKKRFQEDLADAGSSGILIYDIKEITEDAGKIINGYKTRHYTMVLFIDKKNVLDIYITQDIKSKNYRKQIFEKLLGIKSFEEIPEGVAVRIIADKKDSIDLEIRNISPTKIKLNPSEYKEGGIFEKAAAITADSTSIDYDSLSAGNAAIDYDDSTEASFYPPDSIDFDKDILPVTMKINGETSSYYLKAPVFPTANIKKIGEKINEKITAIVLATSPKERKKLAKEFPDEWLTTYKNALSEIALLPREAEQNLYHYHYLVQHYLQYLRGEK